MLTFSLFIDFSLRQWVIDYTHEPKYIFKGFTAKSTVSLTLT
jgi:hypothetical protein